MRENLFSSFSITLNVRGGGCKGKTNHCRGSKRTKKQKNPSMCTSFSTNKSINFHVENGNES